MKCLYSSLQDKSESLVRGPMAGSNGSSPIPAWLSNPNPGVALSLGSSTTGMGPPSVPWLQSQNQNQNQGTESSVAELVECCREVEEGHRAWAAHKKEAAWRLSRVELQMESEKASRRREKSDEVEAKVKALREEQVAALERIEAEYREQLAGLRRDADAKEQKLADLWAAKHSRLAAFLDQMGCRPPNPR